MKYLEDDFKKVESIIAVSKRLLDKNMLIDLKALEKIVLEIHDKVNKDTKSCKQFLSKMEEINDLLDDLGKKIEHGEENDGD